MLCKSVIQFLSTLYYYRVAYFEYFNEQFLKASLSMSGTSDYEISLMYLNTVVSMKYK